MLVCVQKRLEQRSYRHQWKNFKQLPFIHGIGGGSSWQRIGVQEQATNQQDRYAIAMKKNGTWGAVVPHLPRKTARVCSLFLRKGGKACCTVRCLKCSLWINIRAFNFHGWPAPQKYFNNENFPTYGNSH